MENKIAKINTIILNSIQLILKVFISVAALALIINHSFNITNQIVYYVETQTAFQWGMFILRLVVFAGLLAFMFKTLICLALSVGHLFVGIFTENRIVSSLSYFVSSMFLVMEFLPLPISITKILSMESLNAVALFGGFVKFAFIPFLIMALICLLAVIINFVCSIISIIITIRKAVLLKKASKEEMYREVE